MVYGGFGGFNSCFAGFKGVRVKASSSKGFLVLGLILGVFNSLRFLLHLLRRCELGCFLGPLYLRRR